MIKKCVRCHIEKPVTEFHKNRATSDGFQKHCKTCRAAYAKTLNWKAAHKRYQQSEKGKIAIKRYQTSDKGRIAHRRAARKYNRKKRIVPLASEMAHDAVRRAVKSGKLAHATTIP